MSFKDVRDLVEHLKLLGFPKVFPVQSLATPCGTLASFHVVAEILQWLAGLLEPGAHLPGGLETEDERVLLIRSATEFFVTKAAIKLNPRKLYAASAVTCVELQKITRLLIAPTQTEEEPDEEENYRSMSQVDIGNLRNARELATDMTHRGAVLYDLLSKEMVNKEARLAQANRPMELSSVERTLKNAIAAAQIKLQSSRAHLENARVEMNALNSKLQRKRGEYERTRQRLEALQKIRPAHMRELEECEKELRDLFQRYFQRIHVRDALRAQLEARTKRTTPPASPLLQKPAENSMPFIPEGLMDDDDDDEGDDEAILDRSNAGGKPRALYGLDSEIPDIRDEDLMLAKARKAEEKMVTAMGQRRPGSATSRMRPTTGRSRKPPTGRATAMAQSGNEDDDSTFGSSESDLDMGGLIGIGGGLGATGPPGSSMLLSNMGDSLPDDDFDLNSIDDISISKITGELPLRPKTAAKPEHHSDEDF